MQNMIKHSMLACNYAVWVLLLQWQASALISPLPMARPNNHAIPSRFSTVQARMSADNNQNHQDKGKKKKKPPRRKKRKPDRDEEKEQLRKAVGEQMSQQTQNGGAEDDDGLLDKLNPFKAGQSLRKQIDTALTSINIPEERKSIYYVDDRFTNMQQEGLGRLEQNDYIPEILVIGATGEIGRLVVKRLLQEGRSRVRVLVRDLYTKTLNMLGTGVTYCQGDLNNPDSLEYAVTDVDKIIFCTTPPRADEEQFQEKFLEFVEENLDGTGNPALKDAKSATDEEWEQLESVLKVRAELAEQVDFIGVNNVVQAFLNVRHSDYGTSQAAKRSLFKFQGREEDFNLFSLDEGESDDDELELDGGNDEDYSDIYADFDKDYDEYDDEDYEDDFDGDYEGSDNMETRQDQTVKVQTQWLRNEFGHGVFVGRVPKPTDGLQGGEAAFMSTRLRSRQDPENGIDLGIGFGGFIARACSDGGNYEAFVRTKEYYENGIEYVCKFSTASKTPTAANKSRNKFVTVRLPFDSFKPVQRRENATEIDTVPPFRGSDVRNLGFRFRSIDNPVKTKLQPGQWNSFYFALSYIKLYRSQPEPEFIYLSDAQIPPIVKSTMVRHEARQLALADNSDNAVQLLDESTLRSAESNGIGRVSSPEETYYKYRGEETVRNSGLNYAIVRTSGFNEMPAGEATTIDLRSSNNEVTSMSRAEIAQVCVSALMDPYALNKSFYVTKKKGVVQASDEDMREKFRALPVDMVN